MSVCTSSQKADTSLNTWHPRAAGKWPAHMRWTATVIRRFTTIRFRAGVTQTHDRHVQQRRRSGKGRPDAAVAMPRTQSGDRSLLHFLVHVTRMKCQWFWDFVWYFAPRKQFVEQGNGFMWELHLCWLEGYIFVWTAGSTWASIAYVEKILDGDHISCYK